MTKEQALEKIKELEKFILEIDELADLYQLVKSAIKSSNSDYSHYWVMNEEAIIITKNAIKIYLPNANTDWYFDVMDLGKTICATKGYNIYPKGDASSKYLELYVSKN